MTFLVYQFMILVKDESCSTVTESYIFVYDGNTKVKETALMAYITFPGLPGHVFLQVFHHHTLITLVKKLTRSFILKDRDLSTTLEL